MQDTITKIINIHDISGKYFNKKSITYIEQYLESMPTRLKIVQNINANISTIIKDSANELFSQDPELLRPNGNAYTTRRYATCLRDINYYLRYATYAIIANDNYVINERLLAGIKDTYNSLGVPLGPVIKTLHILQAIIIKNLSNENDVIVNKIIKKPFEHIISTLSENNI
uniref:Allophycocyanin beta 18 subunit n=1 Tax=Cyanidium sp. THAL103 TaxID=3027999 RepID=A0A9Y1I449_9RHOD|nr:allophycocyanin beta 18 subunit [Cyanidium sp. THAL103]